MAVTIVVKELPPDLSQRLMEQFPLDSFQTEAEREPGLVLRPLTNLTEEQAGVLDDCVKFARKP